MRAFLVNKFSLVVSFNLYIHFRRAVLGKPIQKENRKFIWKSGIGK
jgi:hypothetical protein